MHRYWIKGLLLATTLFAVGAQAQGSPADTYKEGFHYHVLPLEKSATPEVTKFFSFYCGACFNIEPVIQALETRLPDGVDVRKIHVDFVRGASPEIMALLSKGSLLAKNQDLRNEYHNVVFRRIHTLRKPFMNERDVQQALIEAGVDEKSAAAGLKSFAINSLYHSGEKTLETYVDGQHIRGVPTLVVNNRYRIDHSKLEPGKFAQQLVDLTNYLLTL